MFALYEEFSYDAYRPTDTWVSEDPVSRDRLLQAWSTYATFFVEDGKCGFGGLSYEPAIEVFLEEHGALYLACGLEMKARVETALERLGIPECSSAVSIDNYDHQHVDSILPAAPHEQGLLDETDIKFSVVEGLGMKPTNRHEGTSPERTPTPFWIHVDLDLTFARNRIPRPRRSPTASPLRITMKR